MSSSSPLTPADAPSAPPAGFPDNVEWERFVRACGRTFTRVFESTWRASKMVKAWDLAGRPDPWAGAEPELLAMLHRWAERVDSFGMVAACGQFPTVLDPRDRSRWFIEDDAGRPPDVFQFVARTLAAAGSAAAMPPYTPDAPGAENLGQSRPSPASPAARRTP